MNNLPPELARIVDFLLSQGGLWIYLIVAFAMFCEYVFPPFPGDIIIFTAGFIAVGGKASLGLILILAYIGSACGFSLVYAVGRRHGRKLIETRKIVFINERLLQKSEAWYQKIGAKLLIFSKFLPGIRFVLVFFAGIALVPFRKAFIYISISCVVWNSLVILLAYHLQANLVAIYKLLAAYDDIALALVLLLILFWILFLVWKARRKV